MQITIYSPVYDWVNSADKKVLQEITGYGISEDGAILNVVTGHIQKPSRVKNGYYVVNLKVNGVRITKNVHHVIASSLHKIPCTPEELKDYQVDHIDADPANNHPSNLRWITRNENQALRGRRSKRVMYEARVLAASALLWELCADSDNVELQCEYLDAYRAVWKHYLRCCRDELKYGIAQGFCEKVQMILEEP